MAIELVLEKETGSLNAASVPYYVRDTAVAKLTQTNAVNAVLAQAFIDQGVAASDYRWKRESNTAGRVTVQYRAAGAQTPLTPPSVGTVEAGFDFTMGRIERKVTLNRVNTYGLSAPTFGNVINVPNGDGRWDARGVRLPPPPVKFWRRWTASAATLTDTYANVVAGLAGSVNSLPFKGFAAGSLCLVRASGTLRDNDSASFFFGWGYEPNVTGESWGSFSVNYNGFDYPWAYYVRELVGPVGAKILGVTPTWVFVDQILPYADHNLLGIP